MKKYECVLQDGPKDYFHININYLRKLAKIERGE